MNNDDICRPKEKFGSDIRFWNTNIHMTYTSDKNNETASASLGPSCMDELHGEQSVIDYGAILICRSGSADMAIDFKEWTLHEGAVITLFPGDVVGLRHVTADFSVERLCYGRDLLREASLQLEQTIYAGLRNDRCRTDDPIVRHIVDAMFSLLRLYLDQEECRCKQQLVLLQLKSFFLGFYDWLSRHRSATRLEHEHGSRRVNELFNLFMETLERDYKQSHEVGYYADRLCITPKYLLTIVREITGQSPKTLIDHYVVMQLKLQLRTSDMNIKQLACDYHFSDVSFFCRFFRKHVGMSPQDYRRQVRG